MFLYVIIYIMLQFNFSNAENCCNNKCVKFKDSEAYCSVVTRDIQALTTGYIVNATLGSKNVIENEIVDGQISVNDGINFSNSLTINGELIINGVPYTPSAPEFAFFSYSTSGTVIASGAIVPYDIDVQSTAGITLNGDGSFTLVTPGIYAINFLVNILEIEASFVLSTVPVSGSSNFANTQFARTTSRVPNLGFAIIETTEANTVVGVRNNSSFSSTTNQTLTTGNTIAGVQILKIR